MLKSQFCNISVLYRSRFYEPNNPNQENNYWQSSKQFLRKQFGIVLFFMSSKETSQTSHTKKLESPKENVNITNIIHSVVSLTILSFPCIRFNKLKFLKKIENLKFHSLKVYFLLTSFTIFKIPQVAFNYNKSKCICQQKNTLKTCCSIA